MKRNATNGILTGFFTICFLISGSTFGQTIKKTIANGDWFNPAIWSPVGVPDPNNATDSVTIKHAVTFNQTLDARNVANYAFTINTGASLTGLSVNDTLVLGWDHFFTNRGTITVPGQFVLDNYSMPTAFNYGKIDAGEFYQAGDFDNKAGSLIIASMMETNSNFYNRQNAIIHAGTLVQADHFFNQSGGILTANVMVAFYLSNDQGGIISIPDTIWTDYPMINNGSVSAGNWINMAKVSGVTGKFCVANTIYNNDSITGTVDVCDASPGGPDDFAGHMGTGVTFCATSPCQISGLDDPRNAMITVSVYPNPSSGNFLIETERMNGAQIEIYNALGEKMYTSYLNANGTKELDISETSRGIYFIRIVDGNRMAVKKIMIQ